MHVARAWLLAAIAMLALAAAVHANPNAAIYAEAETTELPVEDFEEDALIQEDVEAAAFMAKPTEEFDGLVVEEEAPVLDIDKGLALEVDRNEPEADAVTEFEEKEAAADRKYDEFLANLEISQSALEAQVELNGKPMEDNGPTQDEIEAAQAYSVPELDSLTDDLEESEDTPADEKAAALTPEGDAWTETEAKIMHAAASDLDVAADESFDAKMSNVDALRAFNLEKERFAVLMEQADHLSQMMQTAVDHAHDSLNLLVQVSQTKLSKRKLNRFERIARVVAKIHNLKAIIPVRQNQISECQKKATKITSKAHEETPEKAKADKDFRSKFDTLTSAKSDMTKSKSCVRMKNIRMHICTTNLHKLRRKGRKLASMVAAYKSEIARQESRQWANNKSDDSTPELKLKRDQIHNEAQEFIDHAKVKITKNEGALKPLAVQGKYWIKQRGLARKERESCKTTLEKNRSVVLKAKMELAQAVLVKRGLRSENKHVQKEKRKQDSRCNKLIKKLGRQQKALSRYQVVLTNLRKSAALA